MRVGSGSPPEEVSRLLITVYYNDQDMNYYF